jgi:hypothetical protein
MKIKEFKQIIISQNDFRPFFLPWNLSNNQFVQEMLDLIGNDEELVIYEISDTFDLLLRNNCDIGEIVKDNIVISGLKFDTPIS